MKVKPLLDVGDAQWAIIQGILQKHIPEREVWAFGSRAKWTAKEFSDLDLVVIGQEPLPLSVAAALADDFSESDLPWKVDLVDWATTSEGFRKIIERDKVVVQKPSNKRGGWGISSDWPMVAIEDVCELIVDCVNKTAPVVDRVTPYRMIRTTNVRNGRIDLAECRYVEESTYKTWTRRAQLQVGDVILTREAPIGEVGFVTEAEGVFLGQRLMQYRANPKVLDSRYLLYCFLSPALQHQFGSHEGSGSVVSHIRVGDCYKFKLQLPPLHMQREIAQMLGALDDRITLLRETNSTLEAIAQALFKSWFVDFDPVHAKMQGRAPEGMDEATAALFPDSFEDSELGPVPKGWHVKSLDSIATFLNGLALQKYPPTGENDLPVIKIAQLRKGDTSGADLASRSIKPEYVVQNGDVLFSWSGSLEVEIWCGGEGALNQHLFKVTSGAFPKWFYFLWTRHHLENFRQVAASKATTMGHIQRAHLTDAKVLAPSDEVLRAAGSVLEPMMQRLIENSLQSSTLAGLRDTLLPRLISGQLQLPETSAQLMEALQ
jgi:type I restriction enzyme, S subunit